ncbi:hypothetical protein [Pseudomonas syringae]|uniref:hypothetical protein n=1 Tax=Pseudomonas TaxID=286 RepID=UPI00036ADAEF|nr:hypothetical protein [Pseudomonas syringae]
MFKNLASLYNLVSTAPVDASGRLIAQVGNFAAGTYREAVYQWIEAANQASVLQKLIGGQKLYAHVVTAQEDTGSGQDVKVRGVFLSEESASDNASAIAEQMKDTVNQELSKDLGEEYSPVGVQQKGRKYLVTCGDEGILATVEIHTHDLTASLDTSGWLFLQPVLQTALPCSGTSQRRIA